ncbi:Kinesin-like protein KIN-6 [Dichanthelium oligosanthes]|uniref:Kinesin-like protein KIN-6 n=1 Tax=Dichanthelium oligosanthes TaxID=888268 RepID=A0A1E5UJ67_9POAL|nr:Kinesin-like protein KIN-6 [Dichanthelium oligosanthes]
MAPATAPSEPASPPPPTTVRRNPPRRARPPPTPLASAKPKPSSLSRLLEDEAAAAASIRPPLPHSSSPQEERLKVFLRIRPLPDRDRCKAVARPMPGKDPRRKPKPAGDGELCLVPTGPNSVALTVPQSKLVDPKRGRTEVFDGFAAVFSPDSTQLDIFTQVMNPLVDVFLGGKSGLLVAMGPTGSGKTHTIFGSPRNPGILPLTLRRILNAQDENKVASQPARSFSLSMFEILSEGKGERILDLLSDAAECVLQQSAIKGLQEVALSNFADAESLVSRGMMKRSTAATNANSKSRHGFLQLSPLVFLKNLFNCGYQCDVKVNFILYYSRSQCIITIRGVHKSSDVDSDHSLSAVLTIADLAGAERERKTGNQGSRLLESNFINNTSMVFSLCLRSLLEHQKNQKKPLEKHFKNSMLTRYLRDYLEGRKQMTLFCLFISGCAIVLSVISHDDPDTNDGYIADGILVPMPNAASVTGARGTINNRCLGLILNVKPADDDYLDTSFLLRQASPYMKIKYTSLDDSSDLVSQKRSNASLICQENKKKRKVQKREVLVVEQKENIDTYNITKVSEKDEAQHKVLKSELRRVSRSEAIMTNFARALWTVLKQYKHKLLESENAAESMKELIKDRDIQIMGLKKELEILNSYCSCKNVTVTEDTSVDQDDSVSSGQASGSLVSLSNKPDLGSYDASVDNFHLVAEEVSKEFTCHGPENSSAPCSLKGESGICDTLSISLIDEQELSSRGLKAENSCCPDAFGPRSHTEKGNTKVEVQEIRMKLDASESSTGQTFAHTGGVMPSSSHSDNQSDQSLPEHHTLPCLKTERVSLSPRFSSCSEKATIEQSEEETEELSKITVDDIQHDINIREVKHPDCLSSSQQVNSDIEDVSSSQSSLELPGMVCTELFISLPNKLRVVYIDISRKIFEGGEECHLVSPQKKLEELDQDPEKCEPGVEKATVEYGTGNMFCLLWMHVSMFAEGNNFPSEGFREVDMWTVIVQQLIGCPAWLCRRLQPAAAMMLKEFTGADLDVDAKRVCMLEMVSVVLFFFLNAHHR